MRVVQALSHSIEEFDMLKMYTRIGVDAFSIGGYVQPNQPHDPKRPPLPEVPFFPELKKAVDDIGAEDNLTAAQERIPDKLLEWLDNDGAIVFHHRLERLALQWPRLRDWMRGHPGRRVIWRSVGQSVAENEAAMRQFIEQGVERVAYSPKEANIPGYTGHAALIRFGKDPAEWHGWTGEDATVLNITQHDATPHGRDVWVNWGFWEDVTKGLPATFAGPHSDLIGGLGTLSLDEMKARLRSSRVYLYTGTQPASYTLGLIEAMMTGIPVVSIPPSYMRIFPYGPSLFEGHEIARWSSIDQMQDGHTRSHEQHVKNTREMLRLALDDHEYATRWSEDTRKRAIDLFGMDAIAAQWASYLGAPVRAEVAA